MSDLVWWTLFATLLLLLIVFTVKLITSIVSDVYCKEESGSKDFEDDFPVEIKKTNEVQNEEDTSPQRYQINPRSLLQNIRETGHHDLERIRLIEENVRRQEEEMNREEEMYVTIAKTGTKDETKKDEDQENYTEEEKQILEKIEDIKSSVQSNAEQIPLCFDRNQLKFYDINQNLLMSAFSLNEIKCEENDKLKRRKDLVSIYIRECQSKLEKKAGENSFIAEETDGQVENEAKESPLSAQEQEIWNQIEKIRTKIEAYAHQIPNCLDGRNHLKYYEINQNLLLCSINLGEIDCQKNDILIKKKQDVSTYIRQCQRQLNKKSERNTM
ncbi:hypothetical protein TcasGA2_TC005822 [Tribolium castaneum]|uniref:Uncharacterized protein n=1 Tax=Tribolium castaneum TaxID=7070 RepID=D6WW32_TRICA|nr:hypothetical protein TcasGA2_TC005822 [Tribolium castaneum]